MFFEAGISTILKGEDTCASEESPAYWAVCGWLLHFTAQAAASYAFLSEHPLLEVWSDFCSFEMLHMLRATLQVKTQISLF